MKIKNLYYITHIDNIPSILKNGILSHTLINKEDIKFTPIYDKQIVSNRAKKNAPNGKSLWDFANLYFQARNPMLYRVAIENGVDNLAILGINPNIIKKDNVFISVGNAASSASEILPAKEGLKVIKQKEIWKIINSEWWREEDGSKRKIMAECLVPEVVPSNFINTIYVANHKTAEKVADIIKTNFPKIAVVPESHLFFLPIWYARLKPNFYLIEGDMLFSKYQTFVISVNTVGVMGKGLASRTKYQFPDVYVLYQDLCKSKVLKMGVPYLYKREFSLDIELADEPQSLTSDNANKWFLLFPTKRHWRENSDIAGIEKGLQWICDNYEKQGIESLAVPALGCGLGKLDWRDVGPLMCRYLSKLKIPVAIYLPREKKIPDEFKTKEFLFG